MEASNQQENMTSIIGQAEIWKLLFSFADSMALRCAVELRIPDIINNSPEGGPISLSQIASGISGGSPPDISILERIMRLLVRRNIFSAVGSSEPILYGLTPSSKWLLSDTSTGQELSLAPMFLMETDPAQMAPWHRFSERVMLGPGSKSAFELTHGKEIWQFAAENPKFNKMFNQGMECTAKTVMRAILAEYAGFRGLKSVVDVGGGTGGAVSEIVKLYPQIEGINYDLPHVIATAPEYPGVCHVGGDMFQSVPKADAVFMKWIMHDWSDKDCIEILKNCRQAIPEKGGKIIIVDVVLHSEGQGPFDDTALVFDLVMIAHTSGKERTEKEWNILLKEGGFPRYNIIKIPAIQSIIEAYPV